MPFVHITLTGPVTTEQKRALVEDVTRSLVTHCGKNPATTHVVISETAAENWGHNGMLVADRQPQEVAPANGPR